jgi:hypothetical protein
MKEFIYVVVSTNASIELYWQVYPEFIEGLRSTLSWLFINKNPHQALPLPA